MSRKKVDIFVYGAEEICASCVNLPSSKDTRDWLDAALARKFPGQSISVEYVDITEQQETGHKAELVKKILEEDLFYPVVVINDRIIGEGNPKLKSVVAELEKYGYIPKS